MGLEPTTFELEVQCATIAPQGLTHTYLTHWFVGVPLLFKRAVEFFPDFVEGTFLVAIVLSLQLLCKGVQVQVAQLLWSEQNFLYGTTRVSIITSLWGVRKVK